MKRIGTESATKGGLHWRRLLMSLFFSVGVVTVSDAFAGDYIGHEGVQGVIAAAEEAGVDPTWSKDLIEAAERQQSILDAIARPAEKTKPWYEYRQIFLTERRIREGAAFWDANASVLETVAERTGVPSEIIVAIIGVETYYGRISGSYRVIDALATLAFDYPRRSAFFTRELEQFLVLAWESNKDPLAMKGSYAGAMGYGQFMPSSYRAYATSFEGASAPDIWDDVADAISSVGNYLKAHGWRAGDGVVVDAIADDAEPGIFDAGLRPSLSVAELALSGVRTVEALMPSTVVTPLRLEEQSGPRHWLGLQNFYVITRYNHSAMYAMAIWELSQALVTERSDEYSR